MANEMKMQENDRGKKYGKCPWLSWISLRLEVIAIFFLLSLYVYLGNSLANDNIIDNEGYRYSLKEEISADESMSIALETFSPESSDLISRVPDIPPDSCDKSVSEKINNSLLRLKGNYIAICKNDLERRQSLFIMTRGRLAAKIDFDTCAPNLEWNYEIGSFVAKAYLRLTNDLGSISEFLVVYLWNPEILLKKHLHPVFNITTSKYYLEYYFRLKEYIKNNIEKRYYYYAEMVAALISSSSLETICKEISAYPLSKVAPQKIKEYIDLSVSYGFPVFDLNNCMGGK